MVSTQFYFIFKVFRIKSKNKKIVDNQTICQIEVRDQLLKTQHSDRALTTPYIPTPMDPSARRLLRLRPAPLRDQECPGCPPRAPAQHCLPEGRGACLRRSPAQLPCRAAGAWLRDGGQEWRLSTLRHLQGMVSANKLKAFPPQVCTGQKLPRTP